MQAHFAHNCIIDVLSLRSTIFYLQWSQNTNIPCRQNVAVCGFREGLQNNWLITQYISRRVGDNLLPQVRLQVLFELNECLTLACLRLFTIHVYETSTENRTMAMEISHYQQVGRVDLFDDFKKSIRNETMEVNFNTDAEGFYIAIRDGTTCIVLQRLIIFYNVCPGGPKDLVVRPETIAPPVGRFHQPLEVTSPCVDFASPIGGDKARVYCIQGGVWSAKPDSGCGCDSGFHSSAGKRSCSGKSIVNLNHRCCPFTSL